MAFIGALVMAFLAIVGLNFVFGIVFGGSKVGAKIAADAIKQKKQQKTPTQPQVESEGESGKDIVE